MKTLRIILLVLIILIQFPLWLGQGSWSNVLRLESKVARQQTDNLALKQKNQKIQAELDDLADGTDVVEGYARKELEMGKQDEVFIQYGQQASK